MYEEYVKTKISEIRGTFAEETAHQLFLKIKKNQKIPGKTYSAIWIQINTSKITQYSFFVTSLPGNHWSNFGGCQI